MDSAEAIFYNFMIFFIGNLRWKFFRINVDTLVFTIKQHNCVYEYVNHFTNAGKNWIFLLDYSYYSDLLIFKIRLSLLMSSFLCVWCDWHWKLNVSIKNCIAMLLTLSATVLDFECLSRISSTCWTLSSMNNLLANLSLLHYR